MAKDRTDVLKRSQQLDLIASFLETILRDEVYGERMGFALFTFPFGEDPDEVGDYVSNAERETMIKFMRGLADRLEKREYIPRVIGEA